MYVCMYVWLYICIWSLLIQYMYLFIYWFEVCMYVCHQDLKLMYVCTYVYVCIGTSWSTAATSPRRWPTIPWARYILAYIHTYMHTYTCPHDLSQDEAVVAGRLDYGRAMRRVFRLTNMTAGAHTKCILANVCMYVCIVGVCMYGMYVHVVLLKAFSMCM